VLRMTATKAGVEARPKRTAARKAPAKRKKAS